MCALLTHYISNTLGLRCSAERVIDIASQSELAAYYAEARQYGKQVLVLGEASNVCLPSHYAGWVLRLVIKGKHVIAETDDWVEVSVGGGENWHDWVTYSLDQGWFGLENLAYIPGTVGAAPVQNIGAYGVSLSDFCVSCDVWCERSQTVISVDHAHCGFDYRQSCFKREQGEFAKVVVAVTFRLNKQACVVCDYPSLQQQLRQYDRDRDLTPRLIYDAVIAVRKKRLPDWTKQGTAGSFFINPIISPATFSGDLKTLLAWVDHKSLEDGRIKIFVGHLLKKSGWMGFSDRGFTLCHHNPIVLVNHQSNQVSRLDLERVVGPVIESVYRQWGIKLVIEPVWVAPVKGVDAKQFDHDSMALKS